jgi:hypothetical protein
MIAMSLCIVSGILCIGVAVIGVEILDLVMLLH